jgi:TRAP-type C4-dicarboxylate transport system permease small subunit
MAVKGRKIKHGACIFTPFATRSSTMGKREPLVYRVSEYYRRFATVLAVLSCATIGIMMFSTTIDTILRYLFNTPIPGIFELNEVILVVCVFMGLAWCQAQRGHIRVIMLLVRLTPRKALVLDTIVWVIAFAFVMILAIETWHDAVYAYSIKMFRWGKVQMPIWWARALVPIGLWLLCIQILLDIWTNVCRLIGYLPTEIPELKEVESPQSPKRE